MFNKYDDLFIKKISWLKLSLKYVTIYNLNKGLINQYIKYTIVILNTYNFLNFTKEKKYYFLKIIIVYYYITL